MRRQQLIRCSEVNATAALSESGSGGNDLGGKQTWRLEHKGMTAAPKWFSVRKSLHGYLLSADLISLQGRPMLWGKERAAAPQRLPGYGSRHPGKDSRASNVGKVPKTSSR